MLDDMRLSKILGFADTDIGKLGKIFFRRSKYDKRDERKITPIFAEKNFMKAFEEEFGKLKIVYKKHHFLMIMKS